MEQIINFVCLCLSVRACVCVCPSVCHYHGSISRSICAKSGTEVTTAKSKNESFGGVNIALPFPYFAPSPQNPAILEQKVQKIHAKINMPISVLNIRESGIPVSHRNSGSGNMLVTSDFRLEVEMSQVRACALKSICNLWPNSRNVLSYTHDDS